MQITLTTPPYITLKVAHNICIHHFNIEIDQYDGEYYGICQQIEAQILCLDN